MRIPRDTMKYKKGWITLNRACNLRCQWCYAKGTGYRQSDSMSLKMAFDIIDMYAKLQLRHITLIGGEPTIYPFLFDVISYANKKGLRSGFLSNGIAYENMSFVQKLYDLGINNFSISLKGNNKASFASTTGFDAYDKVLTGIKNCLSLGASVVVFMVLSEDNIDGFLDCVKELLSIGVKKFHFSFVYNFDNTPGYKGYLEKHNPFIIINKFKAVYNTLDTITNHKSKVFPTFPLCAWGEEFIKTLEEKHQRTGGCQLRDRDDLIFDCNGNIIPCNAMYEIKMGKLYQDFSTTKELLDYCKNSNMTSIYDRYGKLPSDKCKECKDIKLCDCCACQWTNYSYSQLMELTNKTTSKLVVCSDPRRG